MKALAIIYFKKILQSSVTLGRKHGMIKIFGSSFVGLGGFIAIQIMSPLPPLLVGIGMMLMFLGFGAFTTVLHVQGVRTGHPTIEPGQAVIGIIWFYGLALVAIVSGIEKALS